MPLDIALLQRFKCNWYFYDINLVYLLPLSKKCQQYKEREDFTILCMHLISNEIWIMKTRYIELLKAVSLVIDPRGEGIPALANFNRLISRLT
jgi:hypothetical protein